MPFPVNEQFIVETEQQLNLIFPPIFRNRMKEENGGEIEVDGDLWTLYPFFDKSDAKRIKRTCNHIVLETKNSREWDEFPQNAIAIAGNGTGDNLVLLPSEVDKNQLTEKIYLWTHDTGEIIKVGDNINELE